MDDTGRRKSDHIRICLEEEVEVGRDPGWADYRFDHQALPEIKLDEVNPATELLGRRLAWPFLTGAMTGGTKQAWQLNALLAVGAEACGCGMVLGSLRPALEDASALASFDVRHEAPCLPLLLGNIGAAQLAVAGIETRILGLCLRLRLDGIIVHLNPLQEALQPEGDRDWRGLRSRIAELRIAMAREGMALGIKEVGSGISRSTARWIGGLRPDLVETAGLGGTSWARIEGLRSPDDTGSRVARTFETWGHPSVESLASLRKAAPGIPAVASGGLRTGLDLAIALRLGASAGAMALPLLRAAVASEAALASLMNALRKELCLAMFVTGSRTLGDLRRAPIRGPDGKRIPFPRGFAA